MDAPTKEETKASIVAHVTETFATPVEFLVASYQHSTKIPIPTLLAELVMEGKIEQRLFRTRDKPVRIFYFPLGTVNAHFLQSEMKSRVQFRPANFDKLSNEEQWAWDKALGILDWRGES